MTIFGFQINLPILNSFPLNKIFETFSRPVNIDLDHLYLWNSFKSKYNFIVVVY